MKLRIFRFAGGWSYSVDYRDYSFRGWGATRAAALAARMVAVHDVFQKAQRARCEIAA